MHQTVHTSVIRHMQNLSCFQNRLILYIRVNEREQNFS